MNVAPADFALERDLPAGFGEYLLPLHERFTPVQQSLAHGRAVRLERAHQGHLPTYLPPSEATTTNWRIELPAWCADQRNQMTGPADDAELAVKLLNSGSPGVMLDLEDSMANSWDHLMLGHRNLLAALYGELTYDDQKRGQTIGIEPSSTVVWNRVRGLHMSQVLPLRQTQGESAVISASLFDLALLTYRLDYERLKHPLCIYIPKSESAEEALWWRDVFAAIIEAKGWDSGSIKAMALIEAHPIAYEMEEFLFHLRDYILGLNLGRWDYMASLAHFNLHDPRWILPDRNTIPFDVPFFQNLRTLMPEITHKHGALAIGGMTALFPDRANPELNARALEVLERDKKNEADCLMDGAWTGHPDQNAVAVAQFPFPNQLNRRPQLATEQPDLRPAPVGVGATTLDGTRAAVRTVIRYRHGVQNGLGASLLDGYMEDLATDRIYRVMIAQRLRFPGPYTPTSLGQMFDEETAKLGPDYAQARDVSERMILTGEFDPK
jgi:malate synthase